MKQKIIALLLAVLAVSGIQVFVTPRSANAILVNASYQNRPVGWSHASQEWEHSHARGNTANIWIPDICRQNDVSFQVSLNGKYLNDEISSFQSWSWCREVHNQNRLGTPIGGQSPWWGGYNAYIGDPWNDWASSMYYW